MPETTRKTPIPGRPQLTVAEQNRLLSSRSSKFSIESLFKYGYRNKEDVSNLPSSVLVIGSQNVLTNASEIIGIREGYTLDGTAGNENDYGIDSGYDFTNRLGTIRNLSKWGTTLDVRYKNPVTSAVTWITLTTSLNATKVMNFTSFWDSLTEQKTFCLGVNGDNKIYEWSGGVASVASVTANTITISGTKTIQQNGFYSNAANAAKFIVTINGVDYTYTGISPDGLTFTGVTPDPTLVTIAVGDAIIQKISNITGTNITTNGSGNLGTAFVFDLISTLENQVWYGTFDQNNVYVSKTNIYTDVSFSTPARLPAEGALIVLDSAPVSFYPLSNLMYASAGSDQWWQSLKTEITIDVGGVATPTQTLSMQRIKTAFNQASQSQALTSKYKNSIIYVSNEPIVNALGLVLNINDEPQVVNLSDPIKFDVDAYDFTGGSIYYDNYYLYVLIPANGVMRMYNVQKNYWEVPQTIPVSRLYHVLNDDGQTELYGHSAYTNEHYKLFDGVNDNGQPINAVAAFPYVCQQGGSADMYKSFNQIYTEGYISGNTELLLSVNYDFGGFSGTYTTTISGADTPLIFNRVTDGSLGQNTLGTQPIGQILNLPFTPAIPKFRSIKTMPRVDVFEYQIVYSSNQIDAQWSLLRFGPALDSSQALPVSITE